jgi:hypothetical protein
MSNSGRGPEFDQAAVAASLVFAAGSAWDFRGAYPDWEWLPIDPCLAHESVPVLAFDSGGKFRSEEASGRNPTK